MVTAAKASRTSRRMSRYREGGAGADVTTNHLEARCIVENLRAGVGTLLHADSLEDAPPFTSEPSSRGVSALTSTDLHFLATRAGARLLALANGMSNKASVAITCDSSWPLVVSMFACTLVGLPFVPVDLAHPVNRLADILTVVAPCAAVIFEPARTPVYVPACPRTTLHLCNLRPWFKRKRFRLTSSLQTGVRWQLWESWTRW